MQSTIEKQIFSKLNPVITFYPNQIFNLWSYSDGILYFILNYYRSFQTLSNFYEQSKIALNICNFF